MINLFEYKSWPAYFNVSVYQFFFQHFEDILKIPQYSDNRDNFGHHYCSAKFSYRYIPSSSSIKLRLLLPPIITAVATSTRSYLLDHNMLQQGSLTLRKWSNSRSFLGKKLATRCSACRSKQESTFCNKRGCEPMLTMLTWSINFISEERKFKRQWEQGQNQGVEMLTVSWPTKHSPHCWSAP